MFTAIHGEIHIEICGVISDISNEQIQLKTVVLGSVTLVKISFTMFSSLSLMYRLRPFTILFIYRCKIGMSVYNSWICLSKLLRYWSDHRLMVPTQCIQFLTNIFV